MGLLKLFSNRISTEWKEKFNKNIDYLNSLEKELSDQDKSTNSRIDNLVIHSGGDSPNEVVDARVNNKGETFETLHGRLKYAEIEFSDSISSLEKNQADTKAQVSQLNDSIEQIIGGSATWINIYVSAEKGNDQIGDGSEENPFQTIQAAMSQVALITIPSVTIWVDDGVYLEDVILRNTSLTSLYIRPKNDISTINPAVSDLPVKVRSIGFYQVKGYFKVEGIQFVDTTNSAEFEGSKYQLLAEQSGYLAVSKCKFADENRQLGSMGVYAGGTTVCNIYGPSYFRHQNIAVWAKLMSQVLVGDVEGSENTTGVRCDDALVRKNPPSGFADIQTKVNGCGLYITKGTTL